MTGHPEKFQRPAAVRARTRRNVAVGLAVLATTAATTLATTSAFAGSHAAPQARSAAPSAADKHASVSQVGERGFYDARQTGTRTARAAAAKLAAKVSGTPAAQTLQRSLGTSGVLDIDGSTGTVRSLSRLDGFLTPSTSATPGAVVTSYLAAHHDALGLTTSDLRTLHLTRSWTDVAGITHLSYLQRVDGEEVFGNGLTAAVDRSGRLLMLGGSPVSGASAPATTRASGSLRTPAAAISAARGLAQESSVRPGPLDVADRVLMVTPTGSHQAWRTITMSAQNPALSVVDATTGALLYRQPLSQDDHSDPATPTPAPARAKVQAGVGSAFTFFPDAVRGGTYYHYDFAKKGWLNRKATRLYGNNSHAWSDVVDDNVPEADEEVHPKANGSWTYQLKPFTLPGVGFCNDPYPCSWNPSKAYSWQTNRAQNTVQVFFFVNNWHDHLEAAPIGFTEAAGNFQTRNRSGKGKGDDAVRTQTDDGADTDDGLPDGAHIDNANMDTPPDGMAPTMQMYLQHAPGASYPGGDPFSPTNVGDEADTVYHEYTHGLSNRLVVDADGQSTLGGVQAGAMGEAWSDWYAMDYLVKKGLQKDEPSTADMVIFKYDGAGLHLDRTEPMDCIRGGAGAAYSRCTGGETGHTGGYSYADYGKVAGGPEVHADGEIWSQTLWDLRNKIGSGNAESLVTRAMSLSSANPSFLDMRNAILLADTAVFHGRFHATIWKVFAHRGMGFYAGSLGGDDTTPSADFHAAATSSATGTITGTVTDQDSGAPVAGVPVQLAFEGSGTKNPSAITKADGTYSIGPVPVGRYGKIAVSGAGYNPATSSVTVTAGGTTRDFTVRRDWAASSGGASVSDFTGPDFSDFGCGPTQAIDGSQAVGWSSTTGDDMGDPTNVFVPKTLTITLPQAITLTDFGVDPTSACGDGGSASTGAYQIETSPDGTTWTVAASGAFDVSNRGQLNTVTPTAGTAAVKYVRFTIEGNQTPDFATNCPAGSYSGCSFTDLTEVEVFGDPLS